MEERFCPMVFRTALLRHRGTSWGAPRTCDMGEEDQMVERPEYRVLPLEDLRRAGGITHPWRKHA